MKPKIIIKNPFTDLSDYKVIKAFKYILKAKTETNTKPRSVIGIETPLNIIFIASQDKKEKNQNSLSKQKANATPPFVKGKKLYVPNVWAQKIQKFKKLNENASKSKKHENDTTTKN